MSIDPYSDTTGYLKEKSDQQAARIAALESELATSKQTVAELQSRVVAEQQAKNCQAARIAELEGELETAVVALQSALPIGQVKAIGLREVAAGVEHLAAELAELSALRQRCERA